MLTRRQQNERAFKAKRRELRKLKGIWPERDEAYLEWIRHLPCLVTLSRTYGVHDANSLVTMAFSKIAPEPSNPSTRLSEAAHVGDDKGMGQKCSDRETISLSAHYHRTGPQSHHVLTPGTKFFGFHGLNRDEIVKFLNEFYERTKA